MDKLVLASGNAGKLKELSSLLAPLGIEVLPQSAFHVSEAEEPHPSFVENAIAKARHAARATGLPALADDSGLCVDVLGGAPGVLSARFAGVPKSDARNNALLLERLPHTRQGSSVGSFGFSGRYMRDRRSCNAPQSRTRWAFTAAASSFLSAWRS